VLFQPRTPALSVVEFLLGLMFLCWSVGATLIGTKPEVGHLFAIPFRIVGVLVRALFEISVVITLLMSVALLIMIPKAGVYVWVVASLPLIFGAVFLAWLILMWAPGIVLLIPVVAVERNGGVNGSLLLTRECSTQAPWTFLGATVTGLLFSLIPAEIMVGLGFAGDWLRGWPVQHWYSAFINGQPLSAQSGWTVVCGTLFLGLVLLAIATALTNAFLTIRPLVKTSGN
jgi:hypothetical protein